MTESNGNLINYQSVFMQGGLDSYLSWFKKNCKSNSDPLLNFSYPGKEKILSQEKKDQITITAKHTPTKIIDATQNTLKTSSSLSKPAVQHIPTVFKGTELEQKLLSAHKTGKPDNHFRQNYPSYRTCNYIRKNR